MHRLSEPAHFPAGEKAIVTQFAAATLDGIGGSMLIEGNVSEQSVISEMESALRKDPQSRYRVAGTGAKSDPRNAKYPWRYKETVQVKHPEIAEAEAVAQMGPPKSTTSANPAAKGGAR
jgi:hypothetical protein